MLDMATLFAHEIFWKILEVICGMISFLLMIYSILRCGHFPAQQHSNDMQSFILAIYTSFPYQNIQILAWPMRLSAPNKRHFDSFTYKIMTTFWFPCGQDSFLPRQNLAASLPSAAYLVAELGRH